MCVGYLNSMINYCTYIWCQGNLVFIECCLWLFKFICLSSVFVKSLKVEHKWASVSLSTVCTFMRKCTIWQPSYNCLVVYNHCELLLVPGSLQQLVWHWGLISAAKTVGNYCSGTFHRPSHKFQSLSRVWLEHTHNTTQPFYGSVEFVRENPGEPVPEETFTHYSHHSHQSSLSAFSI